MESLYRDFSRNWASRSHLDLTQTSRRRSWLWWSGKSQSNSIQRTVLAQAHTNSALPPAGTRGRAVWYRLDTAVRYQRDGHAFTRSQLGPHGFRGRGLDRGHFLVGGAPAAGAGIWRHDFREGRLSRSGKHVWPVPQQPVGLGRL